MEGCQGFGLKRKPIPRKAKDQERVCRPDTRRRRIIVSIYGAVVVALMVFWTGPAQTADLKTNAAARGTRPSPPSRFTNQNASAAAAILSMDLLDDRQRLGVGDLVSYRVIEDREE